MRGNCKACVPSPSDPAFVSSTCCAVLPWSMQLTLGLLLLPPPHLAHLGAGKTSFLLSSSEQGDAQQMILTGTFLLSGRTHGRKVSINNTLAHQ